MERECESAGFNVDNLIIVGIENFGGSKGQFYFRRNGPGCFKQRTKMEHGYFGRNEKMKARYVSRHLDLIVLVIDENGMMPVFTPDHHFISQDCRLFSKGGAIWFGQLIDWGRFLQKRSSL